MRRRSELASLASWCAAACVCIGAARVAPAQAPSAVEGAPEFLLPIGARSVAMGQAVAAAAVGSDAVWWNPALIARGPREVALHVSQTLASQAGTDAAGVVVYAVPRIGAVALSLRYLSTGQQEAGDTLGTGAFVPISTIAGATFAAPFGNRTSVGVTAKVLQIRFACTGACNTTSSPPTTGALDIGAQYIMRKDSAFMVGAAIRNLGFKLQIVDAPQADALPNRGDLGVAFAPKFDAMPADVRLRTAADVVTRLSGGGGLGYRFGAEISYQDRYQGRAGYVVNGPTGTGSEFTFGLGISTGKLQIDFARVVSDIQTQSGVTPTYISLRYRF